VLCLLSGWQQVHWLRASPQSHSHRLKWRRALCGCLQVHWLRVLIDEGHLLGASLGLANKLAMAVQPLKHCIAGSA
jgi:hypothetical protein